MITLAHTIYDALPAITTCLRAATAAVAFSVGVHRAVRYWRRR